MKLPMKISSLFLILLSINLVACLGEKGPETSETSETSNPITVQQVGSGSEDCDKSASDYTNTLLIHNECIKLENESGTLNVELKSDNAELTGLGLRVHYNSTALSYIDSNSFSKDNIFTDGPFNDSDDIDDDALTDKYINAAWASVGGDWPGKNTINIQTNYAEISLLNINFEIVDSNVINHNINYTTTSIPQGVSIILGK
jgi:hypothetical protein